jgi:hypothetical protein
MGVVEYQHKSNIDYMRIRARFFSPLYLRGLLIRTTDGRIEDVKDRRMHRRMVQQQDLPAERSEV